MATPWTEYIISTPSQFWGELEETLSVPPKATLEQIDLSLKAFVFFCARYYHDFLSASERDLEQAVTMLFASQFFEVHSDRMISLLMDLVETRQSQDPVDSVTKLYVILHSLMQYGRQKPHIFKLLREPRMSAFRQKSKPFIHLLIEILNRTEEEAHATGKDSSVEGMIGLEATELLYEVLRVKRLSKEELPVFNEAFISHLFEIVEQTRDGDEHYNYALIRLIIALNEQFMVAEIDSHSPVDRHHANGHHHSHNRHPVHHHHHQQHHAQHSAPSHSSDQNHHQQQHTTSSKAASNGSTPENLVLKILKNNPGENKTFGENLIFILNRLNSSSGYATPEDLCVSLLILKILYLLFSTSSTSEYFYTNDLRVLVDVFIRELLDLPEESEGLRHTYLRVMHPLMTNTQLRAYPYKRAQIRATLLSLLSDDHIRNVSPTTKRLVERNLKAEWCAALSPAPTNDKEVEMEAQIAKHMSALALKDPTTMHLRPDDANSVHSVHSTLSVNAVAAADVPLKKPRHKNSLPRLHEVPVGHSRSVENPHVHGHGHSTVEMPVYHRHTSSQSNDGSAASPTSPKAPSDGGQPLERKHRTPPSIPHHNHKFAVGYSKSSSDAHTHGRGHMKVEIPTHRERHMSTTSRDSSLSGPTSPSATSEGSHSLSRKSRTPVTSPQSHQFPVGHSRSHENPHIHGHGHQTVEMPIFKRHSSSHSRDGGLHSAGVSTPAEQAEGGHALKKKHRTPPPRPPKHRDKLKGVEEIPSVPSSPPIETAALEEPEFTIPAPPPPATGLKARFRRAPPPTPSRKRRTSSTHVPQI